MLNEGKYSVNEFEVYVPRPVKFRLTECGFLPCIDFGPHSYNVSRELVHSGVKPKRPIRGLQSNHFPARRRS
jgi:hypothetical protein